MNTSQDIQTKQHIAHIVESVYIHTAVMDGQYVKSVAKCFM